MISSSDATSADIDFATGAPIDGAEEPVWIHGAASRKQCTDPAIQVHQSDRHTFILRVSKAVSFEAPFIFLLFGNERAVLFDTGPSADPAKIPLRRTVDELVGAWLAEHPRDGYELVVLGCHIEMSRTPGRDYPAGSTYQPDEVPLRLPAGRIADIRDAARAATKPGVYVHGDFIIWNGGQRLAPMLGQALRLIADNRANRKQARRGGASSAPGSGSG